MGSGGEGERVVTVGEKCSMVRGEWEQVQWVFVAGPPCSESKWQLVVALRPYYLRAWLSLQQLVPTEHQEKPWERLEMVGRRG